MTGDTGAGIHPAVGVGPGSVRRPMDDVRLAGVLLSRREAGRKSWYCSGPPRRLCAGNLALAQSWRAAKIPEAVGRLKHRWSNR
jgi:hypothetical protein